MERRNVRSRERRKVGMVERKNEPMSRGTNKGKADGPRNK